MQRWKIVVELLSQSRLDDQGRGYSPTSTRRNLQLSRLYKQYQTAPDERSRRDYARQIREVEQSIGSHVDVSARAMENVPPGLGHMGSLVATEARRRVDAIEHGDAENTDVFLRDPMRSKRGE